MSNLCNFSLTFSHTLPLDVIYTVTLSHHSSYDVQELRENVLVINYGNVAKRELMNSLWFFSIKNKSTYPFAE